MNDTNLSNKEELIKYLKSHNLWAKHGLGQNFLVNKTALDKIIEAGELNEKDFIIEIGPGIGVLTQELVNKVGSVVAVELDKTLVELLKSNNELRIKNHGDNLEIINADILKLNLPQIIENRPYKVIANIPYYITSKIIQLFLTLENKPKLMVLLVQKEVAERIAAKPGEMSILSLSVQSYGVPEIVGLVPKESFFPVPKVDSAILKISNIQYHFKIPEKELFRVIKIGFSSRRKTLINNLSSGFHLDKETAKGIIEKIGLKDTVRAQELSLEQWHDLSGLLPK